ncbi:MAG: hypothetical protein JWL90_3690 [Chthoniobacteraceae bacterium]|nr:hypothetical protein [Chthoniobacteraceae bacterium]
MKCNLLLAALAGIPLLAQLESVYAVQIEAQPHGNYEGDGYAAQVTEPVPGTFHITGWQHGLPGTSRKVRKVVEANGVKSGAEIVFSGKDWSAQIQPENGLLIGRYSNGQTWRLRKVSK